MIQLASGNRFSTMWMLCVAWLSSLPTLAQDDFESAPIEYSASQPDNCISRLQAKIDKGEVTIDRDGEQGYLKTVLDALQVPVESQVLVFSKTSLQLRRISPKAPRAIYFNDEVYIGYCQSGDVLEVSAVDPNLGAVFYVLDQRSTNKELKFTRQVDSCLVCHSSSRTDSVPGHMVRSLFVDDRGHPVLSGGSHNVNHTTPFKNRWGGWYATGTHGKQTHMGNRTVDEDENYSQEDDASSQNVTSLANRIDTDRYLSPHSDIVALMVLEHQVLVHNRITRANFTTRQALAYDEMMRKVLEKDTQQRLESTDRRIQSAGEKLVEALLLVDEAPLTEPVQGTSGFADHFAQAGPRDSRGRSLRDLDLQTRLFKYPCSYLIYSESFQKLPSDVLRCVWKRMDDVLSGRDASGKFAHLSAADRIAIREILSETLPNAFHTP
jgi:hypothetical protein